ncbi:MAG: hypothetical protein DMG93_12220 [Acidobacteria bacterium]|nr:MAG: hypothetical protein DMG93_12220 [Acidobacteriota bacterium]
MLDNGFRIGKIRGQPIAHLKRPGSFGTLIVNREPRAGRLTELRTAADRELAFSQSLTCCWPFPASKPEISAAELEEYFRRIRPAIRFPKRSSVRGALWRLRSRRSVHKWIGSAEFGVVRGSEDQRRLQKAALALIGGVLFP